MTVDLHDVGPAIVVEVNEAAAPSHITVVDADARDEGDVGKSTVPVVVIQVAGCLLYTSDAADE